MKPYTFNPQPFLADKRTDAGLRDLGAFCDRNADQA